MSQPDPTKAVVAEWKRRIEAEYRSSAITQHLVLLLIQLGAPRELIDDGLRIVTDELDHAELSAAVCRGAGEQVVPTLDRRRLELDARDEPSHERRALFACVQYFCLGETVAVPLFKEMRAECTVPVARAALDRILRDEVRHRQFGWDLIEYLTDVVPDAREQVEGLLPSLLSGLVRVYQRGALTPSSFGATERAWGLLPAECYLPIFKETVEKEYIPRFSAVGIDAGKAWALVSRT